MKDYFENRAKILDICILVNRQIIYQLSSWIPLVAPVRDPALRQRHFRFSSAD